VRQSRSVGDDPVSPTEQRQRIEATCDREGFKLLETFKDVGALNGGVSFWAFTYNIVDDNASAG
jgi:hypothetical protein